MEIWLNSVTGIETAFTSLLMSKRNWTRRDEEHLQSLVNDMTYRNGHIITKDSAKKPEYDKNMSILLKWGTSHITLLKFIDLSVTVHGLHRAGQDDWDSHAKRFDNRIIRNSTRIKTKNEFTSEVSDYYKNRIIPTDVALAFLGIEVPETLTKDGRNYVKTTNGYILEEEKDNPDVKRGLYMLSIPSDFVFKINLAEFAHIYKERNRLGTANPEVKECCETITDQLIDFQPLISREFLLAVKN